MMIDEEIGGYINIVLCEENMSYINGSNTLSLLSKFCELNKLNQPLKCITSSSENLDRLLKQSSPGYDEILIKPINKSKLNKVFQKYQII